MGASNSALIVRVAMNIVLDCLMSTQYRHYLLREEGGITSCYLLNDTLMVLSVDTCGYIWNSWVDLEWNKSCKISLEG